jgi:hypothetical protein
MQRSERKVGAGSGSWKLLGIASLAALLAVVPLARGIGGDPGAGLLAGLEGTWRMALGPADQAALDEARETLKKDPSDPTAGATVEMVEGMLDAFTLVIKGDQFTFVSGDRSESETVVPVGFAGDIVILRPASDPDEEKLYVRVADDGTMIWAGEGDTETMRFERTDGSAAPQDGGSGILEMQLRARRSEAPSMVDAIRTAEKAYHAEWDAFTTVSACPPSSVKLGPHPNAWREGWPCYREMSMLGWAPDGAPYCRYSAQAIETKDGFGDVKITGECDIDGDGVLSIYEATRADKAKLLTPDGVY